MQGRTIRIGTRGSPLALAQAHETRARLMKAHSLPEDAFEIRIYKTSGDIILDRPLADVGGKGLFTKEIEEGLLANEIDLAVHSFKDMQTELPPGLHVGAVLPREDVRDAFLSLKYKSLHEMPAGSVVGTSSLRRQAQVKRVRPDLEVVQFRGNVQTRLRKLNDGVADATLLACAGLRRLGMSDKITAALETKDVLPAVAQGAIAIEARQDDSATQDVIAPLNHADTQICVTAERAFLTRLEGSCRTPIAGNAVKADSSLMFRGMIFSPDGEKCFETSISGDAANAAELGLEAANDLISQGAGAVIAL